MMRALSALTVLLALSIQADGPEPRPDPGSPECLALKDELAPLFETEDAHLGIAEELVGRIEEARSRPGNDPLPCLAQLLEWEGHLRIHTGDLEGSVEVLTEFLDTHRAIAPLEQTASVLRQRGFVLDRLGFLARSTADYSEAASLADELAPPAAVAALRDAGMTFHVLGDYTTAERYYTMAEDVIRRNAPSDSSLLQLRPSILDNRVYLLLKQAEDSVYPDERRELARRAADLAATACGRYEEAGVRVSQRALCRINQAQAERLQSNWRAADHFLALAAPLAREGAAVNPRLTHWLELERGDLARDRGDLEQARRHYSLALESAVHHVDPEDRADIRERIGQVEEELGRLGPAAAAYARAIELREIQRERFRLQEWSISAFANMQRPYRGLARVRIRQGQPAAALAVLDRARARHFRDLRLYNALRFSASDTLRARIDSLVQGIEEERLRILTADLPPGERSASIKRLAGLSAELERLQPSTEDTLSIPHLRRRLGERGQTLLAYLISEPLSVVFLARADTFLARPLPDATPRRVDSLTKAIGAPWNENTIDDPAVSLETLAELYDALIRPVRPLLYDGERLVIIPDFRVAALPFAALVTGDAATYESADYLVEQHAVSMNLTAEQALWEDPPQTDHVGLLAIGRTAFGNTNGLPDLAFVTREIRLVSRRVPGTRSWLDEQATEARFFDLPSEINVLHVASHAIPNASLPAQSRIHLWNDLDNPDYDGVLHLYEFQAALTHRDTPLDLVVLSGCSTVRGKAHAGEGILGLQYAVRAGGARSSLATLWSVDDRTTAGIMDRFYKHLMDGEPKDLALQLAQLDYLRGHEGLDSSPFYWAAATLSGSSRALTSDRRQGNLGLWILMGLAVAGLVAWGITRRARYG